MPQEFRPRKVRDYIGTYRPRIDGWEKASGKTKFVDDITLQRCFPGMLYAKVLTSPYPHARIKHIDVSKAQSLEGVRVILTYDDPEVTSLKPTNESWGDGAETLTYNRMYYPQLKDRKILSNEAFCVGDEVGVVLAADTEEQAEEALRLIEVDWEVLPFVFNTEDAMKKDAPILHPEITGNSNILPESPSIGSHILINRGDSERSFKEAEVISEVNSRYHNPTQAALDNWCCLASWEGDQLTVRSNSYAAWQTRTHLSEMLEIPLKNVRVISPYVGGSHGSRDQGEQPFFIFTALLAKRCGRPVKFKHTRRESFHEARNSEAGYCKIGATKDGKITAIHIKIIGDAGGHADATGPEIELVPAEYIELVMAHIPNIKLESYGIYTNKIPGGCKRSIGYIQVNFLVGLALDDLAEKLGMDPIEVAIKNLGDELSLPNKGIEAILREGARRIGWDKRHKPGEGPILEGNKKRGLGFSINNSWHVSWQEIRRGPLQVIVKVDYDGTVCLEAPTVETGPGSNSCCVFSCADALGVLPEDIKWISTVDTKTGVRDVVQTDSVVGHILPEIIHVAALDAKKQILERASKTFQVPPVDLDIKEGYIYVKKTPEKRVSLNDFLRSGVLVPIIGIGNQLVPGEKTGIAFVATFADIAVDTETGVVDVKKLVIVNDLGTVMYPSGAEGQQIGGQFLAAGETLMEEIIYDKATGIPLNFNLIDYKIPTIADSLFVEPVLMEVWKGAGEYGACGMGESVMVCTPRAIANAIYNAIGIRVDDLPFTPDKILKALGKI